MTVPMYDADTRRAHVDAWKTSGLARKAYSDQHGLNEHTFRKWCDRVGTPGTSSTGRPVTLVPLTVPSSGMIELRCGQGMVLTIPCTVPASWLVAVVHGLTVKRNGN